MALRHWLDGRFLRYVVGAGGVDHRALVRSRLSTGRAAVVARARRRVRAGILGVRLRPLRPPAAVAAAMTRLPVKVTVNGELCEGEVEPRTLLVHFLRDQLGLTGTHVGC